MTLRWNCLSPIKASLHHMEYWKRLMFAQQPRSMKIGIVATSNATMRGVFLKAHRQISSAWLLRIWMLCVEL